MALTKYEEDMNIIQKLDDEPNDVGGLTADELKANFDKGGNLLKQFINNILTAELDDALSQINSAVSQVESDLSDVAGKLYPVGSIYLSVNDISPQTLFGGTWEQLPDRVLIGAGNTYSAGAKGGVSSHTHTTQGHVLSISEMPSHRHNITQMTEYRAEGSASGTQVWCMATTTSKDTESAGDNAAHSHGNTGSASNLPPYLAVYMWKRTA